MIKRFITISLFGIISLNNIQAQETFQKELSIGASFGTTLSKVSFAPTKVQQKMNLGFMGGVSVRWISEKNLGLLAELNFAQQGWEEKFEKQPEYKYSRSINYIELPILTHIYFGNNRFRAFLNLGPKIGYAFGEKTEENLNGASPNTENTQHEMNIEQRFDWGLCGGPGIELRTGIGMFIIEGRYYYALGDIFKSRQEDYFSKSSSQVISAKVTYMIPLFNKIK